MPLRRYDQQEIRDRYANNTFVERTERPLRHAYIGGRERPRFPRAGLPSPGKMVGIRSLEWRILRVMGEKNNQKKKNGRLKTTIIKLTTLPLFKMLIILKAKIQPEGYKSNMLQKFGRQSKLWVKKNSVFKHYFVTRHLTVTDTQYSFQISK